MAGFLDNIGTENKNSPDKTVVHGLGGVGKTTLGIHACKKKKGLFLLGETGLNKLSEGDGIARLGIQAWDVPQNVPDAVQAKFGGVTFKGTLKELMVTEHDYKLLVIDTLDSLVPLMDEYVVWNSYGGDYGKADAYKSKYNDYVREFTAVLKGLDYLIEKKGMEVIILVHSNVTNHKDPSSEAWKRWELALPGGDKTNLGALVYDWADNVIFAKYDVEVSERKGKGRDRVAYTVWDASYDAKTRHSIPEKLEFSYGAITKAIADATKGDNNG